MRIIEKVYINPNYEECVPKEEFKEFSINVMNAVKELTRILEKENNIDFCIVGGIAKFLVYEQTRTTKDIDIFVSIYDIEKISKLQYKYFRPLFPISDMRLNVKYEWFKPKFKLDIVFSGAIFQDSSIEIEEPKNIRIYKYGIPFIELEKLIEYKCNSNRNKDHEDVRSLIKNNNLKKNYADNFNNKSKVKYFKIWNSVLFLDVKK